MHYTPNFYGCHFLARLPLGHLSNSKLHGGYDAKDEKTKYARVFMVKGVVNTQAQLDSMLRISER